jgi:hypothetical protein
VSKHDDFLTLAVFLIVDLDTVDGNFGHGFLLAEY